jgi:type I restriction enzyme S subunit
MRKIKLKEVCDRITVGHVGPMADKYIAEGVPFLRSQNITAFRLNLDDIKFVPPDFHEKLRKSALQAGDVAVVRTGYPGTACVIPNTFTDLNCADLVVITPSKELNPYYLAAIFNSAWGVASVAGNLVGAAQQHFNIGAAREMEVSLPPRPTQDLIAGILSAYEELMENSQRRIRLLETMARALYREWFVHFRFPGHEKHPRVASPLGDIPQGWEVKALSALCSRMESGGTPKRKSSEYWANGSIDWFKTGELWDGFLFGSEEKITERGQRESNARIFEPGTILMAIYGSPTVGRLGIVTRPSSCNQAALGLVADKNQISQTFLYFVLISLREHFNGIAQGAAQQNISKEKVANAVAVVPPRELVAAFDRLAEPTFSQIQTLQRQIQNLRLTRDLLLPRLLSGQLEIGNN